MSHVRSTCSTYPGRESTHGAGGVGDGGGEGGAGRRINLLGTGKYFRYLHGYMEPGKGLKPDPISSSTTGWDNDLVLSMKVS